MEELRPILRDPLARPAGETFVWAPDREFRLHRCSGRAYGCRPPCDEVVDRRRDSSAKPAPRPRRHRGVLRHLSCRRGNKLSRRIDECDRHAEDGLPYSSVTASLHAHSPGTILQRWASRRDAVSTRTGCGSSGGGKWRHDSVDHAHGHRRVDGIGDDGFAKLAPHVNCSSLVTCLLFYPPEVRSKAEARRGQRSSASGKDQRVSPGAPGRNVAAATTQSHRPAGEELCTLGRGGRKNPDSTARDRDDVCRSISIVDCPGNEPYSWFWCL